MEKWAGAPLGHLPASDEGHWTGRTWPADGDFLDEPFVVPIVQRATRAVMGVLLLAAIAYGVFVLSPTRHGDWLPYVALVLAEAILLANAVAMWWTGLVGDGEQWEAPEVHAFRRALLDGTVRPTVDVLITVYGEPIELIQRTVRAARDMRLAHRVYVCDDGRSDEVRRMCETLGVGYFRRNDRTGVKAGNANRALARTDGEFVAIFDADHIPHPDFLVVTLPHLARPDVAFVQCPQAYRTDGGNFVEIASAQSQKVFYEVICPGKNRFNAAFHVGTNAVFRRTALDDVDGFYEDTHSEDIWTSIRLHQRGWTSVYLPHVLARGLCPDTLDGHFRQQFRWASGSFEILLRSNPFRTKGLTFDQRLQYFTPALHFLLGFSNLWFLLLPPLFLLYGITPLQTDSGTWLVRFLPFWLLTQAVLWLQSGGYRLRPIVLSVATAPVHVRAFFAVLLKREPVWRSTRARGIPPTALEVTLPQAILLAINLTGIVIGATTLDKPAGTAICLVLSALNSLMLGRVIAQAITDHRRARATEDHVIDLRTPTDVDRALPLLEGDADAVVIDLRTRDLVAVESATPDRSQQGGPPW
jgi:cellulose synthase (UDP-forming)